MKKLLSLILIAGMVMSVFSVFAIPTSAAMPSSEVMDGYENLLLAYTHNPNRADMGRYTAEDLKPYVGYYNKNGELADFFFDSYLFLPCMSYGPSGARLHHDASAPTKDIDWTTYVEDTFYEGSNVDALEVAFGEAKQKLNDSERKAGVVFSILYPAQDQTDFGSLGGKTLDFTKIDDRKYAVKWMIDEQMKRFNESDYENLDLIGFYWLEEYLVNWGDVAEDKELFKYTSDYLHSLGLKFVWIPWYQANGYNSWKELGFDAVCMQPNMYWQSVPTEGRVAKTANECEVYGMGMEMELDAKALSSAEYYNRYLDYLEGGLQEGAMNSIKMYYQDANTGVYGQAYAASDERARSVYDLTYKYAKGTLTQEDIDDHRSPEFKLPEGVNWRSTGKKYTASKAYSDGSSIGYQQNDGKELTDGIIGASELDTEWHAFHKSLTDNDGRMSVTVNLGAIYTDLTHFMVHFSNVQKYGVGLPADVRIYTSLDGETYEEIAAPELEMLDISAYVSYHCNPIKAQYVKVTFKNSNANFVFCSEVLVGAGDPPATSEGSDEASVDNVNSEIVSEDNAIIEGNSSDNEDSNGGNYWIIIVVCIACVVVIGVVAAIVIKKKKSK